MSAWYDNAELLTVINNMTKAVQYAAAEVIMGNVIVLIASISIAILCIVTIIKIGKVTKTMQDISKNQARIAANIERTADYMEKMLWAKYGNDKKE